MSMVLVIFAGGGIGAVLRYFAGTAATSLMGANFPYGTLFVNILGSLLIGVIMETVAMKANISAQMQAFLVTGILGGFTTFSAFSLDVYKLTEAGRTTDALVYVGCSVFFSLLAAFGGAYLTRGVLA